MGTCLEQLELMHHHHFKDQMGNLVHLPHAPTRIVSLVPSQTELLFDLGLKNEVVGITKFCVHPQDKLGRITRVGGTKNFRFDIIDRLKPDLIIGNKEENYQEGIEILQSKYPVWMSDILNLEDALHMMQQIGQITRHIPEALDLTSQIREDFDKLTYNSQAKKALYLIWKDPYMVTGKDTFIDEMMYLGGFENVIKEERYPVLPLEDIVALKPEVVFLSSEPFPFKESHIQELQVHLPDSTIELVSGEMFSWYGSRLLQTANYLKTLHDKLSPQ